jgi:hypothetical protein
MVWCVRYDVWKFAENRISGLQFGSGGLQNSGTIMQLCDMPTISTRCMAALPFDVVLTGSWWRSPHVGGHSLRPNFSLPLTEDVSDYLLRAALRDRNRYTVYLVTLSPLSLRSTASVTVTVMMYVREENVGRLDTTDDNNLELGGTSHSSGG